MAAEWTRSTGVGGTTRLDEMNKKEINPAIAITIIVAIVVIGVGAFWFATNPSPGKVDLSTKTQADLEDLDPPKPGQPGYRERLTDPPK